MPEPPSNWRSTGIQKVSKQLKEASKGLAALTSDLAHGGLATRLNGGGRAPDGARGTPYSPWLAQPFLKVRPGCSHDHMSHMPCFHILDEAVSLSCGYVSDIDNPGHVGAWALLITSCHTKHSGSGCDYVWVCVNGTDTIAHATSRGCDMLSESIAAGRDSSMRSTPFALVVDVMPDFWR